MEIKGKIVGIKYKVLFSDELKSLSTTDFDINQTPTAFLISDGKINFAISKWVSPKRTRSYPYSRVYNTLDASKKITIIPVVKDEGEDGDRDFIQWDTISLMSLLDVFVVLAYYSSAEKSKNKISKQKFDNSFILEKLTEIGQYHSSALHWNLNELNTQLHNILDNVKSSYSKIQETTGVKLHNFDGIDNFKNKIGSDVSLFMQFSRDKAEQAQSREFVTLQPKENLGSLSKAKITITNFLGGQYFFTVYEVLIEINTVNLIESKHSIKSILPSRGDIKDGLLKMILYCNLTEVTVNGEKMNCKSVLKLTSLKIIGKVTSDSTQEDIEKFFSINKLSVSNKKLLRLLFDEAKTNYFTVYIEQSR